MTVERVIDVLIGLIGPENAEEENDALGKAAKILQLIADNHHLHIHRMRRQGYFYETIEEMTGIPVKALKRCRIFAEKAKERKEKK